MRTLILVALSLSSGCAPFVNSAMLELSATPGRMRASPLEGLALGAATLGGQGPRFRLDADLMGLGFSQSATCDGSDEDERPLLAEVGCAPQGHGYGIGGLGTGGAGSGGAGGGMGRRSGRPHPAQPLLRHQDAQESRSLEASPWGWAVIDLPYRKGPPAQFEARPEARVSTQTLVQQHELSTFGVDVDTAAYSIARRALLSGSRPEPTLVRPEEMLNAFAYRYPQPRGLIGVSTDGARSPYERDRFLLRVGLQAKTVQSARRAPVNLVFLIDTSCSMAGSDRLDLVKDSVQIALKAQQPGDQVAITTYAGSTQVVLPPTDALDIPSVQDALSRLTAAGGTGMATGLELAYEQAEAMHRPGDHSHVVVCSDGDANIGPSNADALLAAISDHARQGIALSTIGFGTGNYRDRVMERLANEGDGSYAYVDAPRQARAVFGVELLRTLQNVARDVKIQVALNSSAVKAWRLVGYENRALKDHEFMDDTVDAGDVGSGHQVTALYELTLHPGAHGHLGEIRVRAQPFEGGAVETVKHEVYVRTIAHPFEHASEDLRWATAVLGFAELLRRSPYASDLKTQDILRVALGAHPEQNPDRAELIALLEAMQRMGLTAAHPAVPGQPLSAVDVAATPSNPSPG